MAFFKILHYANRCHHLNHAVHAILYDFLNDLFWDDDDLMSIDGVLYNITLCH